MIRITYTPDWVMPWKAEYCGRVNYFWTFTMARFWIWRQKNLNRAARAGRNRLKAAKWNMNHGSRG